MKHGIAWIEDTHMVKVSLSQTFEKNQLFDPPVVYRLDNHMSYQTTIEKVINENEIILKLSEILPIGIELRLIWGKINLPVYAGSIVRTAWFDEHYSAFDDEFGALCQIDQTTFKLWAPTATSVNLIINEEKYPMVRKNRGVWSKIIPGDWHGAHYQYEVKVNGVSRLVNDPYAKSMTPNSKKSVAVDLSRTLKMSQSRPKIKNLQDAIIYELHVRDATIHPDSGIKNKGKFIGLAEKNTKTKRGFSTGLSYFKELGITHVELLPINDFARVDETLPQKNYNWGYDPLYYQVPEGSYVEYINDPIARINELKQLFQSLHNEGLLIIVDVVFNHVFIKEDISESVFEKIVPGYFFRFHEDGTLSNGTGVGNDVASERIMVRKFILDTVDFWLNEYHVDGFRFDLMGILDIQTMKAISQRVEKENSPIILLGEGWDLPTALPNELKATSGNSKYLPKIKFFNDYFRDSIKGSTFDHYQKGYVNGEGYFFERLAHLVTGSVLEEYGKPFANEVNQIINYVECHDNLTLWDKLAISNSTDSEFERKKIHQLATGLTLLSQGIPFLHAGQEFFRTKYGDDNSYISPDSINQLDWRLREKELDNIDFVKTLIRLRKKHKVFRLTSKNEIRKRIFILKTPQPVFGYMLLGDKEDVVTYVNPTKSEFSLHLPSPGKWKVAATNDKHRTKTEIIGEYTIIKPLELLVITKSLKIY